MNVDCVSRARPHESNDKYCGKEQDSESQSHKVTKSTGAGWSEVHMKPRTSIKSAQGPGPPEHGACKSSLVIKERKRWFESAGSETYRGKEFSNFRIRA